MVEQHLQEDEAARYVLGQLPSAEQFEFETHLAQSAELRALVQEMEEGVEAIARAVPQRPLPQQAWSPIEQAIAQEARDKIVTPAFWSNWWCNGWAVAAACLLGWLGYAVFTHLSEVRPETPVLAVTANVPGTSAPVPVESNHTASLPNSAAVAAAATANRELGNLRGQLTTLQTQVEHLTQILAQHQAFLAESGRFKFFPLATNATVAGSATTPPLSPQLQRALFYAMARELGWLPATASGEAQNNPTIATNHLGVEFVDLNTPTNNPPATADHPSQEDDATEQLYLAPASVSSSGNIPSFVTNGKDPKLVMAFDSSLVANGSTLAFWQGNQLIGSTMTSDNSTVVTIPTSTSSGWNLTVTANSGAGQSNIIGHFFSP